MAEDSLTALNKLKCGICSRVGIIGEHCFWTVEDDVLKYTDGRRYNVKSENNRHKSWGNNFTCYN